VQFVHLGANRIDELDGYNGSRKAIGCASPAGEQRQDAIA